MATRYYWIGGAVGACIAAAIWLAQAAGDVQIGEQFEPNEAVQTISVQIQVGSEGENLDEPVALDLGLGFPLWLQPLGRDESEPAPFGAVPPNQATGRMIPAGDSGIFEFAATGDVGMDVLHTSQQLLAGVRVSDISRIGFTSRGEHAWVLGSYEIRVNGKPFAANNAINANASEKQETARQRLTELGAAIGPQQTEWADLQALAATGLATDADRTRLRELEAALAPQLAEQRLLERQLAGAAPWFTETDFRNRWRSEGAIENVKLTLVTAPHSGADTQSYVYFQTGGHKYLLGSPSGPLSPENGPQEFQLDLTTAPLTAGDLRGYALGMLAHAQPYGDAPDRWHPQRLLVEVDGRTVYDSEENEIDRTSLSAIRIIPPAHVNAAGEMVENTPNARETYVWEAGSGAGLDLVHGGAAALPEEGDPAHPSAEPGLTPDGEGLAGDDWYDPAAGPFPGEMNFNFTWVDGRWPGMGGMWGGWPGMGPGWDPGWGPGWTPEMNWLGLLYGLLHDLGILPHGVLPLPAGTPPQLEAVALDWSTGTIHWTVTGDESQISHFIVDAVLIRPDLDVPIVQSIHAPITVAAHQCTLPVADLAPFDLPAMGFDEATRAYWAVRVVMIPNDPVIGVDPGLSSAAPFYMTSHPAQIDLAPSFQFDPVGGGMPIDLPVALGGEPELPGPAAWVAGEVDADNGIVFAGLSPMQYHVVARPQNEGDHLQVRFTGTLQGRFRVIGFAGFHGAVETPASANVSGTCRLINLGDPADWIGIPAAAPIEANPALPPSHLAPLVIDIDTVPHFGPGLVGYELIYEFNNLVVDPNHSPTLFGVRLIESP